MQIKSTIYQEKIMLRQRYLKVNYNLLKVYWLIIIFIL